MKLPENQGRKRTNDRWQNAIRACEMVEVPADENDGSGRVLRYCRAIKRHGFSGEQGLSLIRLMLSKYPTPKSWSDSQIASRIEKAKVVSGEAYEEDGVDVPPWEKKRTSPELANGAAMGSADGSTQNGKAERETFANAFDVLKESLLQIENREAEVIYDCGEIFDCLELGPGKIAVVGAPPGTGKTTLASQVSFAAMSNHPDLQLVIANAEMDPSVLVRRELASRANISYQKLRFANYTSSEEDRLYEAGRELTPLLKRTRIMKPPYTMNDLVFGLDEGVQGLVIVDYLQKFRSGDSDANEGIESVMNALRFISMSGWAVLSLSSTSRSDSKGAGRHDTSKLDMGSFRGSGEIEFQADSAYVLRDLSGGAEGDRLMNLDCLKNRHGPRGSSELKFVASELRFEREGPKSFEEFEDFSGGF